MIVSAVRSEPLRSMWVRLASVKSMREASPKLPPSAVSSEPLRSAWVRSA